MRYQLGGRIAEGADLAGNFDDGESDARYRARIAYYERLGQLGYGDETEPRVFGHAGQTVAYPPAISDERPRLPAIGAPS
jgi:hypothetical protein